MANSFDSLEEDMCFVMMTDLVKMETRLLCYGTGALEKAQNAFGISSDDIILKDTLSRKKQVVPLLMESLTKSN